VVDAGSLPLAAGGKIYNLQLTSGLRRSNISTIVALSFDGGRKPCTEEYPLSRGERIITIPIAILAIGLMIATLRVDLASLLSFEATPTATDPESRVESRGLGRVAAHETERNAKPAVLEPPPNRTADPLQATFDVIRIDPEGTSVFAGRGPVGSLLTILANGVAIATVRANNEGQWAIALEHHFDPGEYQFALAAQTGQGEPSPFAQRVSLWLVGAKKSPVAVMDKAAVQQVSLPSPITFIYDEANFTDKGRAQAAVFAAFLQQRHIATATLTGHADERGSDLYNLRLSQERLDAVVRYLREAGFTGKLVLIPLGKREPFAGAERGRLSEVEALALDRRVELKRVQ
jgi:outer membrane protein OmpA-like peptidoglycan-associated protein